MLNAMVIKNENPEIDILGKTRRQSGHNYLSISGINKEPEKTDLEIHELEKLFLYKLPEKRKKSRLLVKRGVANIALLLIDIAVIYTKNKLVYVIDRDSKKYSIDKTLTELEEKLDDTIFLGLTGNISSILIL